jgi:hypothetical protein
VTAEFAAVIPAVVLLLAFALGAIQLCGEQVRLQSLAAQAARELGRGEPVDPGLLHEVSPEAAISETPQGQLVCANARAPASLGILAGISLSATSCSLDDGG